MVSLQKRQSLLASFGFSVAAAVWTTLIGLTTVPVMLHGLGLAGYGTYSVVFSVTTLAMYFDFGMAWSTAKFVAEADMRSEVRQIGTTLLAATLYQVAVGGLFAGLVCGAANWIVASVLHLPAEQVDAAVVVLRTAAVSVFFSGLSAVLLSGLRGLRRFAVATLIGTGATTISVVGAALAAWLGWGMAGAALAQLFGTACGLLLSLAACTWFLRRAEWGTPLWCQMRSMVRFSFWTCLSRMVQMVAFQVDKIVLARWVGPAVVPFYTVPYGFAQRIGFLATPAVTTIYPVAAVGQAERETFVRQYLSASRLLHMLTGGGAIAVLLLGDQFLSAWIGVEMAERGTFFLRVMTVGFWVMSVWSIDSGCIEGWNRPRIGTAIQLVALLVGLFAGGAVWQPLGPAKALAVGVASYFVVCGVGPALVWHRMVRYPFAFTAHRIFLPLVEMGLLGIAAAWLLRQIVDTRAGTIVALLALAGLLAAYGVRRSFRADERASLRTRLLSGLKGRGADAARATG